MTRYNWVSHYLSYVKKLNFHHQETVHRVLVNCPIAGRSLDWSLKICLLPFEDVRLCSSRAGFAVSCSVLRVPRRHGQVCHCIQLRFSGKNWSLPCSSPPSGSRHSEVDAIVTGQHCRELEEPPSWGHEHGLLKPSTLVWTVWSVTLWPKKDFGSWMINSRFPLFDVYGFLFSCVCLFE